MHKQKKTRFRAARRCSDRDVSQEREHNVQTASCSVLNEFILIYDIIQVRKHLLWCVKVDKCGEKVRPGASFEE